MLTDVRESDTFLNVLDLTVLIDPSEEDDRGKLAGCLEDLTFIQAVVAEELKPRVSVGLLQVGETIKLLLQAAVFVRDRMVDQHKGITAAVKDALLKVLPYHFDGVLLEIRFGRVIVLFTSASLDLLDEVSKLCRVRQHILRGFAVELVHHKTRRVEEARGRLALILISFSLSLWFFIEVLEGFHLFHHKFLNWHALNLLQRR